MFTTVPDKTVGDSFTEQMWDTYIKDNLNKGVARPIAETKLTVAGASSITFGSIAADWAHLMLVLRGESDQTTLQAVNLRFNGDSTANYYYEHSYAVGAAMTSSEGVAATAIQIGALPRENGFGGVIRVLIPDYTLASDGVALSDYALVDNNASGSIRRGFAGGCRQALNAAITQVTVSVAAGNFAIATRATLYGLPSLT